METDEIFKIVKEEFQAAILEENRDSPDPFLCVEPSRIAEISRFLRDDPRLDIDLLSCLGGVDVGERLSTVYHLESTKHGHGLVLHADVPREDPRLPSVSEVWPAADWHERESFDLVGIIYEGHPNLVRILCAEDWVGHPLRKDYEFPKEYHGVPCDFDWEDTPWSDKDPGE